MFSKAALLASTLLLTLIPAPSATADIWSVEKDNNCLNAAGAQDIYLFARPHKDDKNTGTNSDDTIDYGAFLNPPDLSVYPTNPGNITVIEVEVVKNSNNGPVVTDYQFDIDPPDGVTNWDLPSNDILAAHKPRIRVHVHWANAGEGICKVAWDNDWE